MRRIRSAPIALALVVCTAALLLGVLPAWAQMPVDEVEALCEARSDNPWLVTANYPRGGQFDHHPALIAFRDTPDDSGHVTLATAGQVGAVYGLAYHGPSATVYAAAFHKRGTHFGPAGPGGIYAVSLRDGEIRTFALVPDAGADTHDASNDYYPDLAARFAAGVTSLGDIDISEDGTELAVVNLNNRRIYRFSVPDGALLGEFGHGAAGEPWAADARPFGLGYRDGQLYHGVVRTAQSSQNNDELQALVYRSAPDGSGMRGVATTNLRYERGDVWSGEGRAIWNPWSDPPGQIHRYGRFPMPILADIAWTASADQMILGLRDRYGDGTFYAVQPTTPPPGEFIHNVPAGDILPAWPEGDGWRIQVDPEHYHGDLGPPRGGGRHDETSYGGLAIIPWADRVAMSANSPRRSNSAGAVWLSTASGDHNAREEIYFFDGSENFGKANGLGDVELLCNLVTQPTPTPTVPPSETPTDSPPTATPTEVVPTPSAVPSATFTPAPPTRTPTATHTLPPGVPTYTPAPPTATPKESTKPPPDGGPTPTPLPKLPRTGRAPGVTAGSGPAVSLWLLALGALAGLAWHRHRLQRGPSGG